MWLPWLMNIALGVPVSLSTNPVREWSEVKWLNATCVGGVCWADSQWAGVGWGGGLSRDRRER